MKKMLPTLLALSLSMALMQPQAFARKVQSQDPQSFSPIVLDQSIPSSLEKTVEIVFVIDTTGSMSGLIQSAKTKVWSIINEVIQNQGNNTKVKIGLVAYRDRGDQYITQITPLSEDFDKVYEILMDYRADGGGDTPEDVRQALKQSVENINWSQNEANTSQIIFLVGDAPSNKYKDMPTTLITAKAAQKRGIIINTVQCGNAQDTKTEWQQIAQFGEGQYFAIAQDGGSVTIETPYDKALVELNNTLGKFSIPYGSQSERQSIRDSKQLFEDKMSSAPMEAQAARSMNKAINKHAEHQKDLIQAYDNKTLNLGEIKTTQLPKKMQKMTLEEQSSYIATQSHERQKVKQEIIDLGKKRDQYIKEKNRSTQSKGDSFDAAVSKALGKQIQ